MLDFYLMVGIWAILTLTDDVYAISIRIDPSLVTLVL
jgi:hypothetical protein